MSNKEKKYFPIKTETACQLKWGWSTLFLNSGLTASCHRASFSELTPENFLNFHNTDRKIADRETMLEGNWPGHGCEFCKDIEVEGGQSDRMFQLSMPDIHPLELESDQSLVEVDPVVLEIYFKNTCNLACIYCRATLSSRIEGEDTKFGFPLHKLAESADLKTKQFDHLIPLFWQWLDKGYSKLKTINVLGGEPFIQDEFHTLLDYIGEHPNKELELVIITNLIIKKETLIVFSKKVKQLIADKKLKKVKILTSVDCWGSEQEYIRYGFDCVKFEENFQYLLEQKFISLGLLSTVTSMSIPSMPLLAEKFTEWNNKREIQWHTGLVVPVDEHALSPSYFEFTLFEKALETVLTHLIDSKTHTETSKVFAGIVNKLKSKSKKNIIGQKKLLTYLTEIDRRRNLNWDETFPWLKESLENVV